MNAGNHLRESESPLHTQLDKGPFKHYVSKKVGRRGQKMAIFAELQYYLC